MRLRLSIDGMTCEHCVASVRVALAQLPGVTAREVRLGEATVDFEQGAAPRATILAAVHAAGPYTVTAFVVEE